MNSMPEIQKMSSKHLNLLLADDDSDDCFIFKAALEGNPVPINITEVHDGEQLMALLTKETYELPHVLFIDLNMPRKNGFECLAEIKLDSRLRQIPVIIYSTSFEHEVVNQLYKSGAQYFIRKPSRFQELQLVIQLALMHIAKADISQPTRDEFVLAVQN